MPPISDSMNGQIPFPQGPSNCLSGRKGAFGALSLVWQPVCLSEIRSGVKDCIFGQCLCQMCVLLMEEGDFEWIARGVL